MASKTEAVAQQEAEMNQLAKLAVEKDRLQQKLKNGGKKPGTKKNKAKGSGMVKIGDTKVKKGELRELAEKGLAIQKAKARELDRNGDLRQDKKQVRQLAMFATGTAAFQSWLRNKTNVYMMMFKVSDDPDKQIIATEALLALGLFYLAEKEKSAKAAKYYMAAALSASCQLGATVGANFKGADKLANKIDVKLKLPIKTPLLP